MYEALEALCARDKLLADVYGRFGAPPLWSRPENFATLVHIILEQKVSLNSAEAVMQRVRTACPTMQTAQFLDLPENILKQAGMSTRKISYCQPAREHSEAGWHEYP